VTRQTRTRDEFARFAQRLRRVVHERQRPVAAEHRPAVRNTDLQRRAVAKEAKATNAHRGVGGHGRSVWRRARDEPADDGEKAIGDALRPHQEHRVLEALLLRPVLRVITNRYKKGLRKREKLRTTDMRSCTMP